MAMSWRKRRLLGGPRVLAGSRLLRLSRQEIEQLELHRATSSEANTGFSTTPTRITSPLAQSGTKSSARKKEGKVTEQKASITTSSKKQGGQRTAPHIKPKIKRYRTRRTTTSDDSQSTGTTVYWIFNTQVHHCCRKLCRCEKKRTQCQRKQIRNGRDPQRIVSEDSKVSNGSRTKCQGQKPVREIPPAKKRKVSTQIERQPKKHSKNCQQSQTPQCSDESSSSRLYSDLDYECSQETHRQRGSDNKGKCVRFGPTAGVKEMKLHEAVARERMELEVRDEECNEEHRGNDQKSDGDTSSTVDDEDQYRHKPSDIDSEDQQDSNSEKEKGIGQEEYKDNGDERESSDISSLPKVLEGIHTDNTYKGANAKGAIEDTTKGNEKVTAAKQAIQTEIEKEMPCTTNVVEIVGKTTHIRTPEEKEPAIENDSVAKKDNTEIPNLVEDAVHNTESEQVEMEDEENNKSMDQKSSTSDETKTERETEGNVAVTASPAGEKLDALNGEAKELSESPDNIISNPMEDEHTVTDASISSDLDSKNTEISGKEDQESPEKADLIDSTESKDEAEWPPTGNRCETKSYEDSKSDSVSKASGETDTDETTETESTVMMQITRHVGEQNQVTGLESETTESMRIAANSQKNLREEDGVEMEVEEQQVT